MRVLAIAGKVDSRVLVYPLARALSIQGLTAVVSEDGAYRRLYHGDELKGTVSGVDISVGVRVDEALVDSIKTNGLDYDSLIVVTGGYIPSNVDGVIICKGLDKSMSAVNETPKNESEATEIKKKKKGNKQEATEEDSTTEETEEAEEIKETVVKEDKFTVPTGVPFTECYISFERPEDKKELGISLKDIAIRYIYNCEESKRLDVLADKAISKTIVKIASTPLGLEEKELSVLMARKEYSNTGKIK